MLDLPGLCHGITRKIRDAQPQYEVVSFDDHLAHVTEQVQRLLAALLEGRGPDETDLRRAAALGRLRAAQGVSLAAVIGAYHVGNGELWRLLVEYAGDHRDGLPELAALMWRSIERVTAEIAAAHSSVSSARQAQALTLRRRLVELLERGEEQGEIVDVAVTLGFDVSAPFVAACLTHPEDVRAGAAAIQEALHGRPALAVGQDGTIVALAQETGPDDLEAVVLRVLPGARLGLGFERAGLSGARQSLRDAMLCLRATTPAAPVRRFADDWLWASVIAERERLEPVLASRRDVIAANAHLVETIEAFVDHGFSVTETARAMHLHPNSVAYRLERWRRLTGWDPKTFHGLSQSVLATLLI